MGFPKGLGIKVKEIIEQLQGNNEDNKRLILEHAGEPIGEMCYRTISEKVAEIGIKICVPVANSCTFGCRSR